MCGVFGALGAASRPADFLERASQALVHRGPDGHGQLVDGPCSLGHRRLAIIDLDQRSAQPMWSSDRSVAVVFNGEIYNYLELRERGPAPQSGWRTLGDTEVLLERWAAGGLKSLSSAVGMFAFAAWHPKEQRLWLVRDRLGKKPLYWALTRSGEFRFASEVPALLLDQEVPRETTPGRLAEFLQYGFIVGPRTGFAGVHLVPQGCALEVWLEHGRVRTRTHRYWQLPSPEAAASEPEWREQFCATLDDAVRIRLRADVPLGSFLSGGVDSSVVSLLAARHLGSARLRTYTADFNDPAFSETAYADEVAQHLGAIQTRLMVEPALDSLASTVVNTWGDLHGDPSAIPTLAIVQEMRRHVTVALSGDGGDELLGGYARYRLALSAHARTQQFPRGVVAGAELTARLLPTWLRGTARLGRWHQRLAQAYPAELRAYATREVPPVVVGQGDPDPLVRSLLRHEHREGLLQVMACDIENYLPEDNLVKVDRASMAASLEVRSPLLDHRLFELVMAARPEWLVDEHGAKRPLRVLFQKDLPDAVFKRAKMGFAPPIASWLRTLGPAQTLERLEVLRDVLDWGETRRQVALYSRGVHGFAGRLWYLLVAAEWWRRWAPSWRSP